MSNFAEYITHGWKLVPIPPGRKGPTSKDWNVLACCVADPKAVMHSAGLAHAFSGTCAIDIDDYEAARDWLAERGGDLDTLFTAPDAVQITSGRANHGKLLFALDKPLTSVQIKGGMDNRAIIDFRCATRAGLTVQDVLPPSIHPDTGRPYAWAYNETLVAHWSNLPPLPDELRAIWLKEIETTETSAVLKEKGASVEELTELLQRQDPNMNRDDWVRIGMILHHERGGDVDGLRLWDEWSRGSDKYQGPQDLETVWRSFHDTAGAVTVASLRREAIATASDFPVVDPNNVPSYDPWEKAAQLKRERFAVTHVSDVAKRPPPQWLVHEVLPEGDLAMLVGESGAGKSFVALDMCFAIASGFRWNDLETKQGTVVWVAAEAAGSMRNRVRAYAQANAFQLEHADLWVIGETPSLMDPDESAALAEAIAAKMPKLIVVDTLAAASAGANENSGEDMNVVMDGCRMLNRETGALVLLVHHVGKDHSRGARGWSGLKAAMDAELTVYLQDGMRVLTISKQRDARDGDAWPFQLTPVTIDFGIESCVVQMQDRALLNKDAVLGSMGRNQRAVLDVIYNMAHTADDAILITQLREQAVRVMPGPEPGKRDMRNQNITKALQDLHNRGLVVVDDDIVRIGAKKDEPEAA